MSGRVAIDLLGRLAGPLVLGLLLLLPRAASDMELARREGSVVAGVGLLALGLGGVVLGRSLARHWRRTGLAAEAALAGVGLRGLLQHGRSGGQPDPGAQALPWLALPPLLLLRSAWTPGEAIALAVLGALFGLQGLLCGGIFGLLERPGRPRPAGGFLLLGLSSLLPLAVALRRIELPAPVDLMAWLSAALARCTPLALLRPAWDEGPLRAVDPLATLLWVLSVLLLLLLGGLWVGPRLPRGEVRG